MPVPTHGPGRWPLVRGFVNLVESLRLGTRSLRWSADLYEQEAGQEPKSAARATKESAASSLFAFSLGVVALANLEPEANAGPPPVTRPSSTPSSSGVLGWLPVVFAIGLFIAAPQAAAELASRVLDLNLSITSPAYQAMTGAAKLVIVVGYLLLIRQVAEIRRVFQYHGAEHKTISTYEAGEPLTAHNAAAKTTLHPRCGTTFLVMVALVSIFVFSFVGHLFPVISDSRLVTSLGFFLMKLPFIPLIAAITYEIQRVFARYCTRGPLRLLLWPGFLVQKITTAEPDAHQLETALASLQVALWREQSPNAPRNEEDQRFGDFNALMSHPGYAS